MLSADFMNLSMLSLVHPPFLHSACAVSIFAFCSAEIFSVAQVCEQSLSFFAWVAPAAQQALSPAYAEVRAKAVAAIKASSLVMMESKTGRAFCRSKFARASGAAKG